MPRRYEQGYATLVTQHEQQHQQDDNEQETARDYLAKWEQRIGPVEAERIMAATRDFLDSLPDDEAADD